MPPVIYVPSRIGEGHFTDFQSPSSGATDNGKIWAWNSATSKFEPIAIPSTSPGGSTGYVQYHNGSGFGGHSGFTYNGAGIVTVATALVVGAMRPASDSTTALQLQNAAGTAVITVDTANKAFGVESTLYKFGMGGAAKNTVFYGLNTAAAVAGDNINYAVLSNQVAGDIYGFNYTAKASGVFVNIFRNSDSASASAHCKFEVSTSTANGGDPKQVFTISGVLNWCIGIDNSDADKLKISRSDSPGSSDIIVMDSAGMYVNGKIGVSNAVTNTNTPSGSTAKALPFYNESGTLLGYVPIYASQW